MISHPRGTLDCSEVILAERVFFRYVHEINCMQTMALHHVLPFALHELQYISYISSFILSHISPNKRNMRQQLRLLLTYNKSIELTIQKPFDEKSLVSWHF